ncbi:MAG: hypothetical protein Q4P14_05100, partial [Methanobacteriaceae archaeon]|nr:hypothetical protein [Methanobacteriaceae archaeon]
MNNLKTEQLRKTGMIADFECRLHNEEDNEFLYVFGVAVRGIVYKCHYISKELLEIEVGDFVLFNGSLCELRMGFAVTYMVEVHVLTLLKLKDMKEFNKEHILIADYRMPGYKLKNNQQNGFIIHRDNKYGVRLR